MCLAGCLAAENLVHMQLFGGLLSPILSDKGYLSAHVILCFVLQVYTEFPLREHNTHIFFPLLFFIYPHLSEQLATSLAPHLLCHLPFFLPKPLLA